MTAIFSRPIVILMLVTVALMVIGVMGPALAGGDKNRTQNPVIDQDGDVVGIVVPNVTCMSLVDQSGQTVWFCTQEDPDEGEED